MTEENKNCGSSSKPGEVENKEHSGCQSSSIALFLMITFCAVLMFGSITVFANPLTPAKMLLKEALAKNMTGINTMQSTLSLNIEKLDLHFPNNPPARAYAQKLSSSKISCHTQTDIANQKMQSTFNLTYNNKHYRLPLIFDDSKCIFQTTGLVQFIKDFYQLGPQVEEMFPRYIYTGPAGEVKISNMWRNFNLWNHNINDTGSSVYKELTLLMLDGLPEKYFGRTALNEITFSFNQEELFDITQTMIKHIYTNKQKYAKIAGEIAAVNGEDKEKAAEQFVKSLEKKPLNKVLQESRENFNELQENFRINRFSIVINKSSGNNIETAPSCDLEIKNSPGSPFYGRLIISGKYTAGYNKNVNINLPELNASNSTCADEL